MANRDQQTGRYSIYVDGEWFIDDLQAFSEALQETYAYFYYINPSVEADDDTRSKFVRYFWSADFVGRRFARDLYYRIPPDHKLRIASIRYSSPGTIDFLGVLSVLLVISLVVRSWAKTGSTVVDLLERIREFFKESKLEKPPKRFDSQLVTPDKIQKADSLGEELAKELDISEEQRKHLVDLTGNSVSALKLLVAVANESRKLDDLRRQGKLSMGDDSERH